MFQNSVWLIVTDALPRAPAELNTNSNEEFQEEVEALVNPVLQQSELNSAWDLIYLGSGCASESSSQASNLCTNLYKFISTGCIVFY